MHDDTHHGASIADLWLLCTLVRETIHIMDTLSIFILVNNGKKS